MIDRELVESIRYVVREEIAPVSLAQQRQADNLLMVGDRLEKLEDAINGNGRPGLREEIAAQKRLCKRNHGSGPPPAPERESMVDIVLAQQRTARKVPWSAIGIILAALITAGATVWASSAAAAAQVRTMIEQR